MKKIQGLIFILFICIFGCMSIARADNADSFAQQQFGMSFDQIKKEAAQGDPDAEYALGYMFYYGKGTPRDEESARMWINKSAAQGQTQAIRAQQLLTQTQQSGQATVNATPDAAVKSDSTSPIGSNASQDLAANANETPAASTQNANTAGPADMPGDDSSMKPAKTRAAKAAATTATVASALASDAVSSSPTSLSSHSKTHLKKHASKPNELATKGKSSEVPSIAGTSLSEKKLMRAPSHYYTIQIVASHNQNELMDFVRLHHLQKDALYYRSSFQGKPWYILVYGIYPSNEAASAAIARMPESVRKANPWARSVGSVQSSIQRRQG